MTVTESSGTFILQHVPSGEAYFLLDDNDYGGIEFHYGSGGKQSPFRVAIPTFAGELLDTTSPNGWKIKGGDEIQIYMQRPVDLTSVLIYDGIVLDVEPLVSEENERVLQLSGVNFGDYWMWSRVFEMDYRTHPEKPSKVITDIITACHPDLQVLAQADLDLLFAAIDATSDTIGKDFLACYCGKALEEVCAAYNIEYYVQPNKIVTFFPVNTNDTGLILTEDDIIGKPRIKWTDDGYHYDEVIVDTVNQMYAPNNASPTGTSVCSDIRFWEARQLSGSNATDAPNDTIIDGFIRYGGLLGATYTVMVLGYAPYASATNPVAVTVRGFAEYKTPDGQTTQWWQGLNAVEAHWDELNFALKNEFNLTDFRIRLNHGKNGSGGYWITNNLMTDSRWNASRGVNKPYNLKLPTSDGVEPGFWTVSGTPTLIDEVQFIFKANSTDDLAMNLTYDSATSQSVLNPDNLTGITYFHFSSTPKASSATNVRTPARQLLLLERTLTEQSDVEQMATAEIDRVRSSALVGSITIDGGQSMTEDSQYLMYPGWDVTLNMTYWGLNSLLTRVDHVVHRVISGRWITTLTFGPFQTQDVQSQQAAFLELNKDLIKGDK